MKLRDESNNTFSTDFEDIAEREVWNDNTAITIGGRVKSQADSTRLQIDSEILLSNACYRKLKPILENFKEELFYTPSRILFGRDSIEEMKVTASAPKIKSRVSGSCTGADEPGFIITITFDEVIDA
jgi:hypothetical protein